MMATPLTLQEMEGYDNIKFLEQPPDSLACPICLAVLHEPHLLSCCGTHICQKCIGEVKADGQPCPCCREVNYDTMLNKQTRGKVLALRVQCNMEGCDWKGELGDLKRHFTDKCSYVKKPCPYGCGQMLPRYILELHKTNGCANQPPQVNAVVLQQQMNSQYKELEKVFRDKTESLEKKCEYIMCQFTSKLELLDKKFEHEIKDLCTKLQEQDTKYNMLLQTSNSQRIKHDREMVNKVQELEKKAHSIVQLESELRETKHALEAQTLKVRRLEQDIERMRDHPPPPLPPYPPPHHGGPHHGHCPPRGRHHFRGHYH